ncbi:MAG: hypothetical protein NZ480_08545 [Bdellovibrionaceae bacterium]|nr:hypothetical protein [Pseudobdellovibrionaceae bacterium]MDW8190111.1 hypothetical protein [Pseudobdellovibrionaceae bacterium]
MRPQHSLPTLLLFATLVVLSTSFNTQNEPQRLTMQQWDLASQGGGGSGAQTEQTKNTNITSPASQAQNQPDFTIDLSTYDTSTKAKINVKINSDKTKALYSLEGGICEKCNPIEEVTINPDDAKDFEYLRMLLAKTALEKLRNDTEKKKESAKKEEGKRIKRMGTSEVTTLCDIDSEEDEHGILTCLKDELSELINECNNISISPTDSENREQVAEARKEERKKKHECFKKAEAHYHRFMRPKLKQALMNSRNLYGMDFEIEGIQRELFTDLPRKFDFIRMDLLHLNRNAVIHRTQLNYQWALSSGATPSYAAVLAKQYLASEMNPYNWSSTARSLVNNIQEFAKTNSVQKDLPQWMQRYNLTFHMPLFNFWMTDHSRGIIQFPSWNDGLAYDPAFHQNSDLLGSIPALNSLGYLASSPSTSIPSSKFGFEYHNRGTTPHVPISLISSPNTPTSYYQTGTSTHYHSYLSGSVGTSVPRASDSGAIPNSHQAPPSGAAQRRASTRVTQ